MSCNLAEILSVGVAAIANLPAPLLPLQILFLNLITDVFPALALGLGRGEEDIMQQPPRDPKKPIIDKAGWYSILLYGLGISMAVLSAVAYAKFVLRLSPLLINNMAFFTLVFAQLLNVFNMPKREVSFFKNEVTKNVWVWWALALSLLLTFMAYSIPFMSKALTFTTLSFEQLATTFLFALGSLGSTLVLKRIFKLSN